MTMKERLEQLKEKCDETRFNVVGIYRDEESHEDYIKYIEPWSGKWHREYPVTYKKLIRKISSFLGGEIPAIFFGMEFLNDEEFMNEVINTLNELKFNPKNMKVFFYKVVN